jgi:hypothetical protein
MSEDDDSGPRDAPLEDLAREVRDRRDTRSEASADDGSAKTDAAPDDDPFEPVDVDEVDDDAVWESFVGGEIDPAERVGLGADVEDTDAPDEHVVPKSSFCQQCPHFADPPSTACTHEGTTIVEALEGDRFRVRNCPIVTERTAEPDDRRAE